MFGVMDGLAKLLAGEYSIVQVVWARYAFAVPVILATARPAAWPDLLRCERPALQAARGLLPLLASVTVIVGLGLMPLADATAISFAAPLLVVALSALLLGERVSVHSWVGVACGFAGILLIVRPGAGAYRPASPRPDSAQSTDRGEDRVQRAQPDDTARHAGLRPGRLIRETGRETPPAVYSCTNAMRCCSNWR